MPHEGQRVIVFLLGLLVQCGGDGGDTDGSCNLGELDCACNQGQCLADLACESNVCVPVGTESTTSGETGTTENETNESSETASTGTESSTDSSCVEPEIDCNGECVNPQVDANNCGECGKVCAVALDTGGCMNGACAPVWSGCMDVQNPVLCPMVCQSGGFVGCMTGSCGEDAASIAYYPALDTCETGSFVAEVELTACETEPNGMNSDFYRCCCDQS